MNQTMQYEQPKKLSSRKDMLNATVIDESYSTNQEYMRMPPPVQSERQT